MKKIEAIIRKSKYSAVRDALHNVGVNFLLLLGCNWFREMKKKDTYTEACHIVQVIFNVDIYQLL